ncbi:hypothetical protein AAY473_037198 [Plecturocebus cupreus]
MNFNTNERLQRALRHNHVVSFIGFSISSVGDLETLPQQALPRNGVASSIKSSSSSCGDLQTLAQQGLPRNCGVPAYIGNEDLETLTLQALQHDLMASSLTQRTTQSTVAQQSSQKPPSSKLGGRRLSWPGQAVAGAAAGLPGETLAQQALQCNCVVAACIGNKDLETLTRQALPHDLMASSFTQSTIQSTVAQQSSQAATVLQARQPEQSWGFRNLASASPPARNRVASSIKSSTSRGGDLETLPREDLLRICMASSIKSPTSSGGDLESLPEQLSCVTTARPRAPWLNNHHRNPQSSKLGGPRLCWPGQAVAGAAQGCQEMHFNTNERPQQALHHNHVASSMGISISSGRDLETLPQQALPHNGVASSIKSSTSSGGDLETLAQQALQCNCVVAAYVSNKDLETLILQALQHDLMASSFTQSTTQSTLAQQSSQEATVLQARQPATVLAWATSSWGCRKADGRCISVLMRGPNKPSSITGCPPPS